MKRILILTDVVYATKIGGGTISDVKEVNLLAKGAICMFTEDNRFINAANANTIFTTKPDTKSVYFAVGSGDATTGAKISGLIDRMSADLIYKAYVAPVKQVIAIGNNGSSGSFNFPTLAAGQVASLRIIDKSLGTQPPANTYRFEYVVKTGDTAAIISAALVAKINLSNAQGNCPFTATDTTTGFHIDATLYGQSFEVTVDDILANATVTTDGTGNSTVIVYGTGTPSQVADIEFECNPVEGDTNRVYMPAKWFTKPSDVDTTATYDLLHIKWMESQVRATGTNIPSNPTVIVALNAAYGTFVAADFDTVLSETFGVNRINSETGK